MSDCGDGGHGEQWYPAARCRRCGHRVSTPVSRPAETRHLPLRYWPFELAARYVARHPVTEMDAYDYSLPARTEGHCPADGAELNADGSCPRGGF